ncbi:hypothetical protein E2P81_ATG02852 [Venturia nashicola]|uniref:Uncharacterized protein n=1 Tax=Venturia nashicola TaxID=86259 RepID=A0A4Z1P9E2_9PEZI|nr:hypothetical protein E6O75_ATG02913 [Venturia nashicola]TLD37070.1 hypothetical protein E2P81_ATG02852 [Venturia nashicola]
MIFGLSPMTMDAPDADRGQWGLSFGRSGLLAVKSVLHLSIHSSLQTGRMGQRSSDTAKCGLSIEIIKASNIRAKRQRAELWYGGMPLSRYYDQYDAENEIKEQDTIADHRCGGGAAVSGRDKEDEADAKREERFGSPISAIPPPNTSSPAPAFSDSARPPIMLTSSRNNHRRRQINPRIKKPRNHIQKNIDDKEMEAERREVEEELRREAETEAERREAEAEALRKDAVVEVLRRESDADVLVHLKRPSLQVETRA